jgi:hypothetical protein
VTPTASASDDVRRARVRRTVAVLAVAAIAAYSLLFVMAAWK